MQSRDLDTPSLWNMSQTGEQDFGADTELSDVSLCCGAARVCFCQGLSDACRGRVVAALGLVGRRRTSLRVGNRGGIGRGGKVRAAYGDLRAAGRPSRVAGRVG